MTPSQNPTFESCVTQLPDGAEEVADSSRLYVKESKFVTNKKYDETLDFATLPKPVFLIQSKQ